ncbi:MAG: hypothetical protein LBE85_03705 [Candidatus Accumulibacter sp.]|jgi:hypothetical protein|nr:hypothetical protein [Accumulibacter sp.]
MILNFFSAARPNHPLGDAKEFKRALAGLPQDPFKAIDEVYTWFESLRQADDFRPNHLFKVVSSLDEAVQRHLKSLSRNYLQTPRLSKNDENRLWSACFNYLGEVSWLYAHCVERFHKNPKDKGNDVFKGSLPLAAARCMAARAGQIKGIDYRYGVVGEDLWRGLGLPYLTAETEGYSTKPVQLYPGEHGMTSVAQQYLRTLVRESSSIGMLLPFEIELADRLIAHFLPGFVFGKEYLPGSMYWVDAAGTQPPTRLAAPPAQSVASLRFFQPGTAYPALEALMRQVERGTIPDELALGADLSAADVLKVLQHLALYWSPTAPQREHVRHAVKTRMAVLQGFDSSLAVFAGNVARLGVERLAESWVVENVSQGGFRAGTNEAGDWLKVGSLLCMQPEGGNNWILGVVRRRSVNTDTQTVGIQTLSRNAQSIELRPRTSGFSATDAIPGILLREESGGDLMRLLLPSGSFSVRAILEFVLDGKRHLLTPVELEEADGEFEIGAYREQILA